MGNERICPICKRPIEEAAREMRLPCERCDFIYGGVCKKTKEDTEMADPKSQTNLLMNEAVELLVNQPPHQGGLDARRKRALRDSLNV